MWWDTLWKLTDYCACDIQATPPGSCRTSARRYLRIALFENCFFLTHHKLCHTTLCTQIPRNCSESTQFISLNFPELTNSLEIPGSLRWYRPSFCLHHILFFSPVSHSNNWIVSNAKTEISGKFAFRWWKCSEHRFYWFWRQWGWHHCQKNTEFRQHQSFSD